MSNEIYDRAMVREQKIWPSFLYSLHDVEATKLLVFGLYANTYVLGHNYLKDISSEELQRLVDTYETNMAELDADDQVLVLQLVAERYAKTIEIQIKNNALATKRQKVSAVESELVAKIEALNVDLEALDTKRSQIDIETDKATLKNKDLVARIESEKLAQNYVDTEISQKQLEAARAELKVLTTALKGLEIQTEIAETSLRIVEIEATKTQYIADLASINVQIATAEASKSEYAAVISEINTQISTLEISKLQYGADVTEIEAEIAKLELSKEDMTSELADIGLRIDETELLRIQYESDISDINLQIAQTDVAKKQYGADVVSNRVKTEKIESSKTQISAEIANIKARTSERDLSEKRLTADQADLVATEQEVFSIVPAKLAVIETRSTGIQEETLKFVDLDIAEEELAMARSDEEVARTLSTITGYGDRQRMSGAERDISEQGDNLSKFLAANREQTRIDVATKRATLPPERSSAARKRKEAAVAAAETMATANITTTLTHEIGAG